MERRHGDLEVLVPDDAGQGSGEIAMKRIQHPAAAGLTMIEVMIATAILGVVLFMAYGILVSTSTTSTRGQLTFNLEARGKQLLERCKVDFYDARFNDTANSGLLGIHDNHTQVHFQVALQQSGGGNVDYGFVGGTLNYADPVTKKLWTGVPPA